MFPGSAEMLPSPRCRAREDDGGRGVSQQRGVDVVGQGPAAGDSVAPLPLPLPSSPRSRAPGERRSFDGPPEPASRPRNPLNIITSPRPLATLPPCPPARPVAHQPCSPRPWPPTRTRSRPMRCASRRRPAATGPSPSATGPSPRGRRTSCRPRRSTSCVLSLARSWEGARGGGAPLARTTRRPTVRES